MSATCFTATFTTATSDSFYILPASSLFHPGVGAGNLKRCLLSFSLAIAPGDRCYVRDVICKLDFLPWTAYGPTSSGCAPVHLANHTLFWQHFHHRLEESPAQLSNRWYTSGYEDLFIQESVAHHTGHYRFSYLCPEGSCLTQLSLSPTQAAADVVTTVPFCVLLELQQESQAPLTANITLSTPSEHYQRRFENIFLTQGSPLPIVTGVAGMPAQGFPMDGPLGGAINPPAAFTATQLPVAAESVTESIASESDAVTTVPESDTDADNSGSHPQSLGLPTAAHTATAQVAHAAPVTVVPLHEDVPGPLISDTQIPVLTETSSASTQYESIDESHADMTVESPSYPVMDVGPISNPADNSPSALLPVESGGLSSLHPSPDHPSAGGPVLEGIPSGSPEISTSPGAYDAPVDLQPGLTAGGAGVAFSGSVPEGIFPVLTEYSDTHPSTTSSPYLPLHSTNDVPRAMSPFGSQGPEYSLEPSTWTVSEPLNGPQPDMTVTGDRTPLVNIEDDAISRKTADIGISPPQLDTSYDPACFLEEESLALPADVSQGQSSSLDSTSSQQFVSRINRLGGISAGEPENTKASSGRDDMPPVAMPGIPPSLLNPSRTPLPSLDKVTVRLSAIDSQIPKASLERASSELVDSVDIEHARMAAREGRSILLESPCGKVRSVSPAKSAPTNLCVSPPSVSYASSASSQIPTPPMPPAGVPPTTNTTEVGDAKTGFQFEASNGDVPHVIPRQHKRKLAAPIPIRKPEQDPGIAKAFALDLIWEIDNPACHVAHFIEYYLNVDPTGTFYRDEATLFQKFQELAPTHLLPRHGFTWLDYRSAIRDILDAAVNNRGTSTTAPQNAHPSVQGNFIRRSWQRTLHTLRSRTGLLCCRLRGESKRKASPQAE